MHRDPTAISLVETATPNIPVRSHRPISENVVYSIPADASLATEGSAQTPAQELRDLERARHALRDRLRQRHERVDLAGVLAVAHLHAGLAPSVHVSPALRPNLTEPDR